MKHHGALWLFIFALIFMSALFIWTSPNFEETYEGNTITFTLVANGFVEVKDFVQGIEVQIGGVFTPDDQYSLPREQVPQEMAFVVYSGETLLRGVFIEGPLADPSAHDFYEGELPSSTLHNPSVRRLSVVLTAPEGQTLSATQTKTPEGENSERFWLAVALTVGFLMIGCGGSVLLRLEGFSG